MGYTCRVVNFNHADPGCKAIFYFDLDSPRTTPIQIWLSLLPCRLAYPLGRTHANILGEDSGYPIPPPLNLPLVTVPQVGEPRVPPRMTIYHTAARLPSSPLSAVVRVFASLQGGTARVDHGDRSQNGNSRSGNSSSSTADVSGTGTRPVFALTVPRERPDVCVDAGPPQPEPSVRGTFSMVSRWDGPRGPPGFVPMAAPAVSNRGNGP